MSSFQLRIVCPDGCLYDGEADYLKVRTTTGDVGILAHHIKYAAALGMGECKIKMGEETRYAACIGGMLSVADNKVNVVATTFEWKEDIDLERAKIALSKAEEKLLSNPENLTKEIYEAKKRRAQVRIGVAEKK